MTSAQWIVTGCFALLLAALAIVTVRQREALTELEREMWVISRYAVICAGLRSDYNASLRAATASIDGAKILVVMGLLARDREVVEIIDNLQESMDDDIQDRKMSAQAASFRHNEDCLDLGLDSLPSLATP